MDYIIFTKYNTNLQFCLTVSIFCILRILITLLKNEILFPKLFNMPYQIIFSDIEMPEMDGMTLAQNIRELDNYNPFIIFTTFYPKYMQDSFDVQPFQYLTKPLSFDAIKSVIDKIIKKLDKNSHITAITDENGETHFVCLKDIIYISSLKLRKQYVQYHLVQEDILCRDTISNLEVLLSDKGFVSPTRGLLVNVRHIKSFDATTIKLKNSETVPVSRRRIKIIQETYVKHIIELIN